MDIGSILEQVNEILTALLGTEPTAYVVVFAMSAIDVLFPLIPSEAIVLFAAVLAGSGQLNVVVLAVAAALGAFVGDNVAHGIGRFMGRPLIERVLRGRADRLEWMEARLQRHGPSLIIVGRFIPGGRSLVAVGSGVIRMPWRTFAFYDAVAVTIWSLQVVIPGYIGGSAFSEQPWLGFVVGALISLTVVAVIEVARWFRRQRRGESVPDGLEDPVARVLDRVTKRLAGHEAGKAEGPPKRG